MSAAPFPAPTFEVWTGAVSLYLEHYAGRPLADAPLSIREQCLPHWFARGWRAHEVAERLVGYHWPHRVTLIRYYTDRRPREVLQAILEKRGIYERPS